ncbi:MAG: COQ9 family protein [Alphaproteobacteria bacterium]|nr:COQ9 family protein [Alphaproteobacteria bacterium]
MDTMQVKDRLLLAVLPNVAFDGWSIAALRAGARNLALDEAEAIALFPRGGIELVAWFSRWADRAMLAAVAGAEFEALKIRERIAAAIRARLAALEPHREASRRALALLALPQNMPLGLRLLYDTVDAAWYAAGDTATDFNFYTKRALLAGVYGATLLYWLDDRSPGSIETHAFLDRRIADAMAVPKLTQRLREALDRLPNPARLWQAAQRR